MFCYQCQEAAGNTGCTKIGVCGKSPDVANLQDLLLFNARGLAQTVQLARSQNLIDQNRLQSESRFLMDCLFATITNANFDAAWFNNQIRETAAHLAALPKVTVKRSAEAPWRDANPDLQSLRDLILFGLKGLAAYGHHAFVLGYDDPSVHEYMVEGLAAIEDTTLSVDELVAQVLKCGATGVTAMALLDKANTESYGHPEITSVNIGVRKNPAILISGHDLRDLQELLEQTEGTGVDVYTHSEMLPAHYYPAFKKFRHFAGNYGNAWWKQAEEFETFNGPVLFTTNCIVPPKVSYKDRIYTTGVSGFEGCVHIADRKPGGTKDFSTLIAHAKKCPSPTEIETGTITGGFAHKTVLSLADKVLGAVKAGKIRRFVVMAGCDGRQKSREYYTDFAKGLNKDAVILTAGCAKYRYNKLDLGDIDGIPRVLDAGQCNDSYSLAVIAMELAKALGVGVNDLPITYNIAWYEQKAVIVLLALLSLGVKNIHLGPTLPAFLSPNVAKVLVETFGIAGKGTVEEDLALIG
jgi:hydroxylamine reductase